MREHIKIEEDVLAAAIAILSQGEDVTPYLSKIKSDFFSSPQLKRFFKKIVDNPSLNTLFATLNGNSVIFYELLERSHDIPSPVLAITTLTKILIDNYKQREITRLQKEIARTKYPEDRDALYAKIKEIENIDPFSDEAKYAIKEKLLQKTLKEDSFMVETNWLYQDLILPGTLNVFFSPPSQGKSAFALSLACQLLREEKVNEVHYIDGDNPINVLAKRCLPDIIKTHKNLFYYKPTTAKEMRELLQEVSRLPYGGVLIVVDSLKDLAGGDYSLDSTKEAAYIQGLLQYARDGEGYPKTVIVLHHVSKNTDRIRAKNSTTFIDGADTAYVFEKKNQDDEAIYITVEYNPEKGCKSRIAVKEKFNFKIYLNQAFMEEIDEILSKEDKYFINKVREILKHYGRPLKQKELINELKNAGYSYKKAHMLLSRLSRYFIIKSTGFPKTLHYYLPEWRNKDVHTETF